MDTRKPRKANIRWDVSVHRYRVSFSFCREFVFFLKSLPAETRTFNSITKTWTFEEEHLDAVSTRARSLFDSVRVESRVPPPTQSFVSGTDGLILDFVRELPKEALHSAYRAAARECHPDRGGSNERMLRLNSLWEQIKREILGETSDA